MKAALQVMLFAGALGFAAAPARAVPEDVTFRISPSSGAQARFIEFVLFDRCRRRQVDPWSESCGRWRPILNNQVFHIKGRYCVYARWSSDNREHRGGFVMPAGGSPFPYPIEPQGRASKGTC